MLVVVVCEIITWQLRLDTHGVMILGEIDGGFPVPALPDLTLDDVRDYLPNSLTIGLLGFIESIAVAKLYARKNNYMVGASCRL